jgi:hypothetical protein
VPSALPVATPVVALIDAVEPRLLDHVPPVDVLVSNVVLPRHTRAGEGSMAAGNAFTVIGFVTLQPVLVCVKVILEVPCDTPPTTPVVDGVADTEATPVEELLHVPDAVLANVTVLPTHTDVGVVGVIAAGAALTTTAGVVTLTVQPAALVAEKVYPPAEAAVTLNESLWLVDE